MALAALATLGACGPQGTTNPAPTPSPHARVRTTPLPLDQVPPDVAQQWGDIGATIVPPTDYLQHIDLKAEVINHSGGKVDDATARLWAEAFVRELRWDQWAIEKQQNMLLKQLAAPDGFTQQAVLGDDYGYIHRAQDSGGQLTSVVPSVTRITIVPVSADTKSSLTTTFSYPAPVPDIALIVSTAGPITVTLAAPQGQPQKLADLPSSFQEDVFAAGGYKDFPGTLGGLWVLHTYLSCQKNDFLRAACSA